MVKWNFKRELARKFVHILSVFILLIYFVVAENFNSKIALLILVLILIVFLEFEYLRIEVAKEIPFLNKIWKYVRRAKEKEKVGGDIFFLVGAILVLAVFDLRIAIAAILMTIFGDLSAALIGQRFGRHWLGFLEDRAWEGILVEFFINILIGGFVFFGLTWSLDFRWIIVLTMALTATIVETLIYKMDDNLIIPVFAGFNGQIALLIIRWLF